MGTDVASLGLLTLRFAYAEPFLKRLSVNNFHCIVWNVDMGATCSAVSGLRSYQHACIELHASEFNAAFSKLCARNVIQRLISGNCWAVLRDLEFNRDATNCTTSR